MSGESTRAERAGAAPVGLRGPALNAVVGAPLVRHVIVRPGTEGYWRALKDVLDPELPISVVDMGLIYDIRQAGEAGDGAAGDVRLDVTMTFTATACPCMAFMLMDVRDRLLEEEGVRDVAIEVVWDPPWTRRMVTEEGRVRLKEYGVVV